MGKVLQLACLLIYLSSSRPALYPNKKLRTFLKTIANSNDLRNNLITIQEVEPNGLSKVNPGKQWQRVHIQKAESIDDGKIGKSAETIRLVRKVNKMDDEYGKQKGKIRFPNPFVWKVVRRANSESSSSSSRELKDWKEEFREKWLHSKFEALNQSVPSGDQVNMVAARPWGVSCGDPNQHDVPWGSCVLAMECEPEYRIYRGDYYCGRTQFVCCAIMLTNYDMNQGFDASLNVDTMSTDSNEIRERNRNSREARKRRERKEKHKRKRLRRDRKKKMVKFIRRIVKEIRKLLSKQYRNSTRQRKRRITKLKKFLKDLKKQYRADKKSVNNLHDKNMLQIDRELHNRLSHIKTMNKKFVDNATFRDLVVNGTQQRQRVAARLLLDAYPELGDMLNNSRREQWRPPYTTDTPLQYDLEYGYLYY